MNNEVPEEIAALRRRLAELERMAAERHDAAQSEVDVDAVIRRVSAQGRGAATSRTPSKEKTQHE